MFAKKKDLKDLERHVNELEEELYKIQRDLKSVIAETNPVVGDILERPTWWNAVCGKHTMPLYRIVLLILVELGLKVELPKETARLVKREENAGE